jgi:hypothetical protein
MNIKMVHKDRNVKVTEENKRFYRKDKKLTPYSFACGYIEVYESTLKIAYHVYMASPDFWTEKELVKVFIEKDGCYHVKMYINDTENRFMYLFAHLSSWESFDTLTEARKYCASLLKEIQNIEVQNEEI